HLDDARIERELRDGVQPLCVRIEDEMRLGDLPDRRPLELDRCSDADAARVAREFDAVEDRRAARIAQRLPAGVEKRERRVLRARLPLQRPLGRVECDAARDQLLPGAHADAHPLGAGVDDDAALVPEPRLGMYQMVEGGAYEGVDLDLLS